MTSVAAPLESLAASPLRDMGKGSSRKDQRSQVDIIDIREATVEFSLKEEIYHLFRLQEGTRKLPTLLLYDEKGLQLFEDVSRASQ